MRLLQNVLTAVILLALSRSLYAQVIPAEEFVKFCDQQYAESKACPSSLCELKCVGSKKNMPFAECKAESTATLFCVRKECKAISPESCPEKYCSVVVDCSKSKNCLEKIPEDQVPECGPLAYSAQDVGCCKGLVKRCGFDYMDGKCNMEGKNTSYRFPICIPCGDGVCTNFENHCNCPEDCKKDIIPLD